MAFAITGSRLVKHDVGRSAAGRTCDVEYDVDFTGEFDPLAAEAVLTLTPEGFGAPVSTAWGSELAPGSSIYCVNKRASWRSHPHGANVPGEYVLTLTYAEGNEIAENPLDRPDQIFWSRAGVATPFYTDADGKPVTTVAKEVFANLPTVNVAGFSATITGYRAGYSELRFSPDKFNVVNVDALNLKGVTVNAKKARYVTAATRDERINGYDVVAYTWQLDFKDSWDFKPMHVGNYELKSGKSVRIVDSLGLMRQGAWPLSAAGVALADTYAAGDVTYLDFKATIEINFAAAFGWSFT